MEFRVFYGRLKYVDRFICLAHFVSRECGPQHMEASSVDMRCSHPGRLCLL